MLNADKLYRAALDSLKKECETENIRLIDTEEVARKMTVKLAVVVMEEVQRIIEELTKQYTMVSIPYRHIMLKGPECLGNHGAKLTVCQTCGSQKMCMTVTEWRLHADRSEQATTQGGEGGDLQGQEGEVLDPVRGRP